MTTLNITGIATDSAGSQTPFVGTITMQPPPGPTPLPGPALISSSTWPGQAGNLVGPTAASGYLGSLTPGGTIVAGGTYNFKIWDTGTAGFLVNVPNVTFNGCQFASNLTGYYNVAIGASGSATFNYCSFTPRPSIVTSPVGGFVWPSATAAHAIPGGQGYQYGIELLPGAGAVVMDHCDMWGFANAVDFHSRSQTKPFTMTNCWIHDPRNPAAFSDHTDGPGDLSGQNVAQSYITISGNVIAADGANTNAIAMQGPSAAYNHCTFTGNYFSGYGACCDFTHGYSGCSNITVTDNTWSTFYPWLWSPIYNNPAANFTNHNGNLWRRNKILVAPGTVPVGSNPSFPFVQADDGKFLLPNVTMSTTDWAL